MIELSLVFFLEFSSYFASCSLSRETSTLDCAMSPHHDTAARTSVISMWATCPHALDPSNLYLPTISTFVSHPLSFTGFPGQSLSHLPT